MPEEAMKKSEEVAPTPRQQVRYVGSSGERVFYAGDWTHVGIEGRTVRWVWPDQLTVPMEDLDFLTPEQFNQYILRDGAFVVENIDS